MAPAGDLPVGAPFSAQWDLQPGGPEPEEVVWNTDHLLSTLTFSCPPGDVFYNRLGQIQ